MSSSSTTKTKFEMFSHQNNIYSAEKKHQFFDLLKALDVFDNNLLFSNCRITYIIEGEVVEQKVIKINPIVYELLEKNK